PLQRASDAAESVAVEERRRELDLSLQEEAERGRSLPARGQDHRIERERGGARARKTRAAGRCGVVAAASGRPGVAARARRAAAVTEAEGRPGRAADARPGA